VAPKSHVGRAAGIPDYRFGVVEAYSAPAAASALGAGWGRATFEWARIQPGGPDEWNPLPFSDAALNRELAQGRQVVGLLITIPHWAIDPANGLPKGLYLAPDDPGNLWAAFVRQVVGRHAGRIDHWIIWNEPEIPRGSPDASWPGSIPDYVQLLRVAYLVAKEANPASVVHLAAVSHYHDPDWYNRFLDTLVSDPAAAHNNHYFDVASLNLYHEPEKIYDIVTHYVRMLRGKGLHKPLWITETNAYLSRISEIEQAIFMVQAFSLEIAAGASRIAVYKMIDTETDQAADPEPFGLVKADGTRRPAFTAYRTAAAHLSGFRGGSWERRDSVAVIVIDRGPKTTTVVWSRTPDDQTVELPARAGRALAIDVWGSTRIIYPQDGTYVLGVGGADCSKGCVLGGPPLMLVEDAPTVSGAEAPPPAPTVPAPRGPGEVQGGAPTATRRLTPVVYPTWPPTVPPPTRPPTSTPEPTSTPTRTGSPVPTDTPGATEVPTSTPIEPSTPTEATESEPLGGGWLAWAIMAAGVALVGAAVVFTVRRRR
jgi:hypothetical protein